MVSADGVPAGETSKGNIHGLSISLAELRSKWYRARARRVQQISALPTASLHAILRSEGLVKVSIAEEPPSTCEDRFRLVNYIVNGLLNRYFSGAANPSDYSTTRQLHLDSFVKLLKAIDNHTAAAFRNQFHEELESAPLKQVDGQTSSTTNSSTLRQSSPSPTNSVVHAESSQVPSTKSPPQVTDVSQGVLPEAVPSSPQKADYDPQVTRDQHRKNSPKENTIRENGSVTSNLISLSAPFEAPEGDTTTSKPLSDVTPTANIATSSPTEKKTLELVTVPPIPINPPPASYLDSKAIHFDPKHLIRLALHPTGLNRANPEVVIVEMDAENHLAAPVAALSSRPACYVTYFNPPLSTNLPLLEHNALVKDFHARLQRWDPFWKCRHDIVDICSIPRKSAICKTYSIIEANRIGQDGAPIPLPLITTHPVTNIQVVPTRGIPTGIPEDARPKQCCAIEFKIPSYIFAEVGKDLGWGVAMSSDLPMVSGRLRFICRMLPLEDKAKKSYLADCHQWPKGTFLQIGQGQSGSHQKNPNYRSGIPLTQRRQQSHDLSLWKGNCKHLDLTGFITQPLSLNHIKLVTREDAKYGISLCIAEYQSPEDVFEEALRNITIVDYQEAQKRAKDYVNDQTISLDDSEDEADSKDGGAHRGAHLKFKAVCPISMKAMEIPVRGKNCRHFQCFELFNFISSNSFPSGRRWKCPCCDNFVSLDSLEVCGFFRQVVAQHKTEIEEEGKDTVNVYSDGSWEICKEAEHKRRSDVVLQKQQEHEQNSKKKRVEEIEILD